MTSTLSGRWKVLAVMAVVVVFLAVLVVKTQQSEPADAADSMTAQRGDAVAAFEQAQAADRPIYLLFHSMTCEPCVEISANVDQVMPGYMDRVTFVNAITDDSSAQQLAAKFSFQYIPTSFFIGRDGTVVDTYTGVLSPDELKTRLDKLAGS